MFSVKHGLPCNILASNSFIPQFKFVCIRVWVPYFSEHSIVSISYRETWKMERKSLVAIQRKSSNEKAQNVSENMDYIVLSGTKSRDCPTFNDLRSLNHIRVPKRTRSIYENREIISHKKNYFNSFPPLQRLQAPMVRLSLLQEVKSDAINRTFLSRL